MTKVKTRGGAHREGRPSGADALAPFYTSMVDGMALRARDGASRKTLNGIADCIAAAWDATTASGDGTVAVPMLGAKDRGISV